MTAPAADASALTAAWLTEALAPRLDGARVTSVEAEPVGTGQVAQTLRLTLAYDRPAPLPTSLIAKVASPDPASREAAKIVRTYEIEAGFYETLAPLLDASIPACHFTAHDPETDAYTVILDDLSPGTPGDQLAGLSVADAEAAVTELATLHAAAWEHPALSEHEWLQRDAPEATDFTAMLVTGMYEGFRDRYSERLDPETLPLIEAFLPSLAAYLRRPEGPVTLAHGDYRADNLLFNRPRPVILDWQTCMRGAGASDLAYFLSSSLPAADRAAHEERLVRTYQERLAALGVAYDWDECWTSYRRYAFTGIVMAIGASMLVERTDRGDTMFCTMADRHARQALDLGALSLLG